MEAATGVAASTPTTPALPGWYPNPVDRDSARWWDGSRWTPAVRRSEPVAAPRARLGRWAYVGVAASVAGSLAVILLF